MMMLNDLRTVFIEALSYAPDNVKAALIEKWNRECENVYEYKRSLVTEERTKATANIITLKDEVVKEIFTEIEKLLDNYSTAQCFQGEVTVHKCFEGELESAIAELKKKYVEV